MSETAAAALAPRVRASQLVALVRTRTELRVEMLRLLRDAGWPAPVAAALQVVSGLLPVAFILATSTLLGRIPAAVDGGTGSPAWSSLEHALYLSGALFLVQQLVAPVAVALGTRIEWRVDGVGRRRLLEAAFRSDGVGPLEDAETQSALRDAGESLQRRNGHSQGEAAAASLMLFGRYVQLTALGVVVGAVYSWPAALLVVGGTLAIRVVWRGGLAGIGGAWEATSALRHRAWYLRELGIRPEAAKELRVFDALPWVRQRFHVAALAWFEPMWRKRMQVFFKPFVPATLVGIAAMSGVLALVASDVGAGSVDLRTLAIVLQSTLSAIRLAGYFNPYDPATEFGMFGFTALRRFERAMAAHSAAAPAGHRDPAGLPARELRFENVTFGYPGAGAPVLAGLDLSIPAGRSLAIVGLNGAGKTTLVKLLARLYEPQSGAITVDGVDVREFPVRAWQRRIGAIFQDFVHYELPVRDNVAFGAIELRDDDARVWRALERAGARELVEELPRGLDAVVSRQYEDGVELSGGQWQRLAIARALFAIEGGASILVLDEPTANLDVRAEARFFDEFIALTSGLTTIVISHRFSTVRRADRIVVVEAGAVVEDGTHEQLVAAGGRYAELFELQAARFGDEEEATAR